MASGPSLKLVLVVGLVVLAGCATFGGADTPSVPETSVGPPAQSEVTRSTPSSPGSSSTGSSTGAEGTTSKTEGTLEVHFINVGQSSSTLIVGPTNETMLIDSGDWRDDGEHVISHLERLGIDRIDTLITTHADADHIGGHAAVIDHFETNGEGVGAVYDPGIASSSQTYQRYLDAVEEHNVPLYRTRAGDRIPFEGVTVSVLSPPEENLAVGDRNENSLVLQLTFGESSFLFTGDAEDEAESYLVANHQGDLATTVLSAGHHGSRSSTSGALLDATRPKAVVISSAYDSQFGHPHEEILERLTARGIPTYWTAVHGTVTFVSDGSTVTIYAQQDATTDSLALRSESPVSPSATASLSKVGTIDAESGRTTSPETPTPMRTDGGTETESDGGLTVSEVHADASGNDNENLNDEYVVFRNDGESSLDLAGWTVEDEAGHTYTFPSGFTLDSGAEVTLFTGSGTNTASERYWESESAIWNNSGDTIIVRNESGELVLEVSY